MTHDRRDEVDHWHSELGPSASPLFSLVALDCVVQLSLSSYTSSTCHEFFTKNYERSCEASACLISDVA